LYVWIVLSVMIKKRVIASTQQQTQGKGYPTASTSATSEAHSELSSFLSSSKSRAVTFVYISHNSEVTK
jgi:hypothetical protein